VPYSAILKIAELSGMIGRKEMTGIEIVLVDFVVRVAN